MATRLGLGLPQNKQYDIGRDVPDVARAAEEMGYESLWVYERALFPEAPGSQGLYGIEGLPWPDRLTVEKTGLHVDLDLATGVHATAGDIDVKLQDVLGRRPVDIGAFLLDDGRRITVEAGWNGEDERVRRFLRAVHQAGCRRFGVTLGPDANAWHRDHLHFDMGRGPYCR